VGSPSFPSLLHKGERKGNEGDLRARVGVRVERARCGITLIPLTPPQRREERD